MMTHPEVDTCEICFQGMNRDPYPRPDYTIRLYWNRFKLRLQKP